MCLQRILEKLKVCLRKEYLKNWRRLYSTRYSFFKKGSRILSRIFTWNLCTSPKPTFGKNRKLVWKISRILSSFLHDIIKAFLVLRKRYRDDSDDYELYTSYGKTFLTFSSFLGTGTLNINEKSDNEAKISVWPNMIWEFFILFYTM